MSNDLFISFESLQPPLKVADGDEFPVPHPDYIFLPPKSSAKRTYVMVHNDAGFASVLPLLTITSLTFQIDANN